MDACRHHVSGFFATRDAARERFDALLEQGQPRAQIQLFATDEPQDFAPPAGDSNAVLQKVLVDGAIGTAMGNGLGALGEVALVAANVSLFIASPLLAPLVMLGWDGMGCPSIGAVVGASVGATAGATPSAAPGQGWLSTLVGDPIADGQVVLVVETRTPEPTRIARDLIRASAGDYSDVVTA